MNRATCPERVPAGFTLVEVTIATSILSILVLAMGSAVAIARHAVPDAARGPGAVVASAQAIDLLAADLLYATSLDTAQANEIAVSTPDRNDDGVPETIRYSWSGAAGDPLTRSVNGGPPAAVAANVRNFQLAYPTRAVELPAENSEGPEILLASYNTSRYTLSWTVSQSRWIAEYFRPQLPSDATSWSVTRVRFLGDSAGWANGNVQVQLRPAVLGMPGTGVLAETTIRESSLHGYWIDVPLVGASGLPPTAELCVVIRGLDLFDSGEIRYEWMASPSPGCKTLTSSSGGAGWSELSGSHLRFFVYGKAVQPNPPRSKQTLLRVDCTLEIGDGSAGRVQTSLPVVNEIEVGAP